MEDEVFLDLGAQSDDDLRRLIDEALDGWKQAGSDERRLLQGKIDIFRAELINRRRKRREP